MPAMTRKTRPAVAEISSIKMSNLIVGVRYGLFHSPTHWKFKRSCKLKRKYENATVSNPIVNGERLFAAMKSTVYRFIAKSDSKIYYTCD